MVKEKKKPTVKIAARKFQNSEFVFLRDQIPGKDSDYHQEIKDGVMYVHGWGTGYETLIFKDHEAATKWWDAEVKRLTDKKS